jgi:hypothetical protein
MLKKIYRLLLIISSKVMSLVCHSRSCLRPVGDRLGIFHILKPEGLRTNRNDRNRHGNVILLMNLLVIILISIIFPASAYSSSGYSSSDWKITLKVSGGGTYDYCIAGVKNGANDGRDNAWDIPARMSLNKTTYIYAYFPHERTEEGWENSVFDKFRQDIKAPDLPKEWVFGVSCSNNISGEMTITWPDLKNAIPDKKAELVEINEAEEEINMRIDMHTASSFVFVNDGFPRRFKVMISQETPSVTPPVTPEPNPPEGLTGTWDRKKAAVLLYWNGNLEPDLAGYNVYRSITPESGYDKISSLVSVPKYVDTQIVKGNTYYYVVKAVNTAGGESGYYNEVKVIVAKSKEGKGKK